MSQNHMSKKELNEDPFFEEVAHIVEFFRKHQVLLIGIVVALVLAAAIIFGGSAMAKNQNEKAVGQYGIAMDYYNKAQYVEAEENFMILAEQYKRTDWGKRAYYYLALVSQNQGGEDIENLEYLEKFVSLDLEDDALNSAAYKLIASYYYRNGEMENAADNYVLAAEKTLSLKDKVNLGIKAGNLYAEAKDSQNLDRVVSYLSSLELSSNDEARVKVLAKR